MSRVRLRVLLGLRLAFLRVVSLEQQLLQFPFEEPVPHLSNHLVVKRTKRLLDLLGYGDLMTPITALRADEPSGAGDLCHTDRPDVDRYRDQRDRLHRGAGTR